MKALVVLLALSSVACLVRNPSDVAEEKTEQEHQRREFVRKENRQREADRTVAIKANSERVLGEGRENRETARASKLEAERLACEEGRPARVQDRERYRTAIEHKHELETWENAHCKFVERSSGPRILATQDSRGEIRLFQRDGVSVQRVCNAPLPKDLQHIEASQIFIPQPTFAMGCEKHDTEAAR